MFLSGISIFYFKYLSKGLLGWKYLKLKTSFGSRNLFVSELNVIYVSLMSKSKSHVNIRDGTNKAKWKAKKSVLMFQELLNLIFRPGLITLQNVYII